MKRLPMLSLLSCLVLASCGGDASDPAPAPHELALATASPAASATAQSATPGSTQVVTQVSTQALARGPALQAANGTLRICRTLPGTKVPLCRSGRWPARFGPVTHSLALAPITASGKPAPSMRSDPGTDDPPPSGPPPSGPPPSGPPPAGTPPGAPKAIPVALLFEADGHAEVCAFTGAAFRCARIAATVPLGVTVGAWPLPGGYEALTYTRAPGVHGTPDPKGQAALRFQAAFDIAVKAVRSAVGSSASVNRNAGARLRTGPGTTANLDDADPDGNGEDWGGGGWGGDWGGGWGGGWGSGDSGGTGAGDVPVDPVPAPAPNQGDIGSIPVVIITGHADTIDSEVIELPPRDMNDDLAALSDPCLISPIITVCIRGQRPPPPPDEVPDPPRPTPWFPQSWCDWSAVLCSAGQQPAPPPTEAERRERERQQCYAEANGHADYCREMQNIFSDATFKQCIKNAIAEAKDCETLYGR